MTTVFDAPMQDFSADNTMDTEMLPSAPMSSDADWLQVESMMEDGESQKPPEVDMSHSDLQEFEMRDVGDADVEFGGDYDQMVPDESRHLFSAEPQDQDIPDASRAPSPSALASTSQHLGFAASIRSEEAPREPSVEPEHHQEVTPPLQADPTASHQDGEPGEPSTHPQEFHDEVVDAPKADAQADVQDTSTISGESTRSPQVQQQHPSLENSEYPDPIGISTEFSQVDQNEGPNEDYADPGDSVAGVEPEPQAEATTENQVTEADDEGLLLDPPPSVLLSYPFDNSRFAFFNLSDEPQAVQVPAPSRLEPTPAAGGPAKSESKANPSTDRQAPSEPEHHTQSEEPILLFRERFALYYEPLSAVFEALRADGGINVDGRFDHNIELVLSVPELDLTLPEDNIHAREVSLHDLGVLHNGCDLNGALSLRLDTISPRFGSRYKAIRDEIVRVVSQQEDDERHSLLVSGDGYLDGAQLNESPEGQVQDEGPYHHTLEPSEPVGDDHLQSSEQQPVEGRDAEQEHEAPSSQQVEEAEEQAETDTHEQDASGEYTAYYEYDEGNVGDETGQGYEDAEGEYEEEDEGESGEASYDGVEADSYVEDPEKQPDGAHPLHEEEHVESLGFEEENPSLDAVGDSFDDIYESMALSGDGETSTAEMSGEREATSLTQYVAPDESTDARASTSGAVTNNFIGTPELEANLAEEIALYESVPPANAFTDAESLLSEARSRSRSPTPRPSADIGQDEVIAYEETVEDEITTVHPGLLPTGSDLDSGVSSTTSHSVYGSRAVSTASKRSYDEHELEQLDGADPEHSASVESKRLRVD